MRDTHMDDTHYVICEGAAMLSVPYSGFNEAMTEAQRLAGLPANKGKGVEFHVLGSVGYIKSSAPEPVIEKGDVVEYSENHDPEISHTVVAVDDNIGKVALKSSAGFLSMVTTSTLTLIRKGPKTITFEGMGIVLGNQLHGDDIGSITEGTGIFALSNNDKTYTMTFKEEQ